MLNHTASKGFLAAALSLIAGHSLAADATLELLAQKGLITADEYASLKDKQKDQAIVSLKDGLKISSADGSNVLFGTLIQIDAAHFGRHSKDAPDGTEVRRARLSFSGNTGPWEFRLEGEFAGTATLTDAYGAWRGPVTVTAGNFKLPYSLEALMSDKNLAFMERSLSSALLPARAPAFMLGNGYTHGSWAAGIFSEPLSSVSPPTASGNSATANADDKGGGISARATWAPLIGDGHVLHIGASLHYRVPSQAGTGASETLRLSSKPEANLFPDKLINTGDIAGDAESFQLAALELAAATGPLVLQSEYSVARLTRDKAADARLEGGYLQASWAITGETRAYKADKGVFEGIRPQQALAWEVAARLSQLDLSDIGLNGGRESDATLALNAYAGPAVKLSLNYVKVLDVHGGPFKGDESSAVMIRAQLAY